MARILIVEGADRGLRLAGTLIADGHAVRIVTSESARRDSIERAGAECFLGTPERLATMRGALEHVTIACWLLADASDDPALVRALHGPRLERFVCSAIDTTLRGFLYEAGGSVVAAEVLAEGQRIVSETAMRNSIPTATLTADPLDCDAWLVQARTALGELLEGGRDGVRTRYADMYIPKSRSAFGGDEVSTQEDS